MPLLALFALLACTDGQPLDTAPPTTTDTASTDSAATDTAVPAPAWPDGPQLLLYLRHNLLTDEGLADALSLIQRAGAAGYTGVVVADFKVSILHHAEFDASRDTWLDHLGQLLDAAAAQGMVAIPTLFPFGYSEAILRSDPNLAEGQPVLGTPFVVAPDGGSLALASTFAGLTNGGFEDGTGPAASGWDWQDEPGTRTTVDSTVAHSGSRSLRIDAGTGNARLVQSFDVAPWQQLHVRFWARTRGFDTDWFNAVLLDAETGRQRNFQSWSVASDQDWTRYDFAVNTGESTRLGLYLGAWTRSEGTLWLDDVRVAETAFVNLLRRSGTPLVLRDAAGTALVEATDFDALVDPDLGDGETYDDWHEPPTVTLPATTSLAPGDIVTADSFSVAPVYGYQVGACLVEPAVSTWMDESLAAVLAAFPDAPAVFFQHDEMRHLNTCGACAQQGLDAGDLLAAHVADATDRVLTARPGTRVVVWSDMFDPHHNAHADYYLAHGDVAGSWEGLAPDTLVANWNLGGLAESGAFFADRGHLQLVAGYYDSGDGAASAQAEAAAMAGLDGHAGHMYTTWQDDHSQLEAYAEAVWAARGR